MGARLAVAFVSSGCAHRPIVPRSMAACSVACRSNGLKRRPAFVRRRLALGTSREGTRRRPHGILCSTCTSNSTFSGPLC
eukprot:scaffold8311_cov71-Phaeocystis_antarctica.AAC.5